MNEFQKYLNNALPQVTLNQAPENETPDDYDIFQEISASIAAARDELGLTQKELAKRSGVSQSNISKFENGSARPQISTLKKLADGLGKKLAISFADREDE